MIKNIKWLCLASLSLIACNNDDETVVTNNSSDGQPLTAGSADFTKYVALGDSFAAGYSDSALFIEGQKGAYPNILAQQFAQVGGGAFTTPFMNDNIGGFLSGGVQSTSYGVRLYFNGSGPVSVTGPSTTDIAAHLSGSFNNMGVPGARSYHLDYAGYGSSAGNPYFARFASNPMATVVDDAVAQSPTFFSLWIGGNDVLGYASTGGLNDTDITSVPLFTSAYNGLITKLINGGRKGVIANLPYINTLPLFTTVPTNPIPGLPTANATQLNQLFGGINAALASAGLPARFSTLVADDGNAATTEANPLLIIDESLISISSQITTALMAPPYNYPAANAGFIGNLYGQARHATSTNAAARDFVLLTARGVIGTTTTSAPAPFNTVGVSYPMQDGTTLTIDEISKIKTATDAYNSVILNAATTNNLAFFDAKSVMSQLGTTGFTANGFTLTASYVTGGAFSLDGVHPSPRGYALIANKFLEAINTKYGSNFKSVDLGNYRILFPQNPANF